MSMGKCPRCSEELHQGAAGPVSGRACRLCGGVWIERDISDRFAKALAERGTLEVSESARIMGESTSARAKRKKIDTAPDGLPCVVCSAAMRREHLEKAGFDLDLCEGHGTWFDRGELATVAHLLGAKAPSALDDEGGGKGGSLGKSDGSTGAAVALGVLGIIFDIIS